jgi:hypothetical protein
LDTLAPLFSTWMFSAGISMAAGLLVAAGVETAEPMFATGGLALGQAPA